MTVALGAATDAQEPVSAAGAEASVVLAGLLAPIWLESLDIQSETANGTAFKAVLQRVIVRKSGTLRKLWVGNGTVINGNFRVAIYDIGATTAGKYKVLYSGAITAQAGEGKWQLAGEPNLAVTVGQELMVAFMSDSATAKYGQTTQHLDVGLNQLPTDFEVHGLSPIYMGFHQYAELVFTDLAGEITAGGVPWAVIGRIE